MLTPIVCITCGFPIADVADLYLSLCAEASAAALKLRGTLPDFASIDSGLQVDYEKIFEALNVTRGCCRTRLACAMLYSKYY